MKIFTRIILGMVITVNTLLASYFDEGMKAFDNANYNLALNLFTKSCNVNNNKSSCHNVGHIYDNGLGVKKNYLQSIEYYKKGCNLGYAGSCYSVGIMYRTGQGVNKDDNQAKYYFELACNKGLMDGCRQYKQSFGTYDTLSCVTDYVFDNGKINKDVPYQYRYPFIELTNNRPDIVKMFFGKSSQNNYLDNSNKTIFTASQRINIGKYGKGITYINKKHDRFLDVFANGKIFFGVKENGRFYRTMKLYCKDIRYKKELDYLK
ncbi:MAG: tetratricopeptide repeat protein [Campylobacterota bacterium]|nr:tetratricopeptide repeat protein [Campylobacterota bacterium]